MYIFQYILNLIINTIQSIVALALLLFLIAITLSGITQCWDYVRSLWAKHNNKSRKVRIAILDAQAEIRKTKEAAAYEGFYEEFSPPGLPKCTFQVITPEAEEYYREMDKLVDEQIFLNTEEF